MLEFFGPGDVILVGLGHECEHKVSAIARSKQLSPELGKASYKLVNINMTGGGSQYVEYVLIGYGVNVDALASLQGPGLPGQAAGGGSFQTPAIHTGNAFSGVAFVPWRRVSHSGCGSGPGDMPGRALGGHHATQ